MSSEKKVDFKNIPLEKIQSPNDQKTETVPNSLFTKKMLGKTRYLRWLSAILM